MTTWLTTWLLPLIASVAPRKNGTLGAVSPANQDPEQSKGLPVSRPLIANVPPTVNTPRRGHGECRKPPIVPDPVPPDRDVMKYTFTPTGRYAHAPKPRMFG